MARMRSILVCFFMNSNYVAALFLLTLLAGCASTKGLFTHATVDEPNSLATRDSLSRVELSPAAWPATDWWKQFNDPQLDQLMDEALAGSPTLRIAEARARKALAVAQSARSALFPQINADGYVTRERFPPHGLIPPPYAGTWNTLAQLESTLNYEVDLWGRNRSAYESALGQGRAAEIDAFAARLALSVDVAQAYIQLERAFDQLDVEQNTLKERTAIHELTVERYDAGIDSQLAVKQAETALPATRQPVLSSTLMTCLRSTS